MQIGAYSRQSGDHPVLCELASGSREENTRVRRTVKVSRRGRARDRGAPRRCTVSNEGEVRLWFMLLPIFDSVLSSSYSISHRFPKSRQPSRRPELYSSRDPSWLSCFAVWHNGRVRGRFIGTSRRLFAAAYCRCTRFVQPERQDSPNYTTQKTKKAKTISETLTI